jgi:asparagine synthase (glutamine-hydrolysing)
MVNCPLFTTVTSDTASAVRHTHGMCGITGFFDLRDQRSASRETLERMTSRLVHRGPDSDGFYIEDGLGLGFRRLSIIDLRTGDQPMVSADGSLVLLCNGEIFNYRELRTRLESQGHRFSTACDVEVLLYLYQERGIDLLSCLNGQFAFVIYDRPARRLFLARDHVGIAPLFYTVADGVFVFGSEIKAILEHPLVERRVDLTGLDQVLSFPGLVSPTTMFEGIRSLAPGHMLLVENGAVTEREYWDLDFPLATDAAPVRDEEDTILELRDKLDRAVRFRLQADVPVGYYLSGGLDSSLVTSMGFAAAPDTNRATLSIRFEDQDICESRFQRLMVDRLRSEHHEIVFGWQQISESLAEMVRHSECPVKESYNTCAMALSRVARAQGIRVVLAGQGADELFAGYIGYRFDEVRAHDADVLDPEAMMEAELRRRVLGDEQLFYETNQHALREIKSAFYSEAVNARYAQFDCLEQPLVNTSRVRGRHPLHQRSYLDLKLRLGDHLLGDHGDRMMLMNSVEGRYPFLDQDVVEFVRTLPPDLKLRSGVEKYAVKRAAEPFVPKAIIDREKFGFRAPASPYLIRQHVEWIEDLLSHDRIKAQGYFNPVFIDRLKARYRDDLGMNPHHENDLLMIAITFGVMLQTFDLPSL